MAGSGIGQFAKTNQTTDILIFFDAVNAHNQSFPQQNLFAPVSLVALANMTKKLRCTFGSREVW